MSLNPNSNDDLLKTLGVERDLDTYKNSAYHITLVLKNLTDKIDELRKSQSTISEQPKKSEISKNIDELKKASLDILFTEYTNQYNLFALSKETTQPKNPNALILNDEVDIQVKGITNSKKLSRAEFEEVLISGNDEHSKKIDFDTSSNLPLNAVIIRHSDCIEKLKSPKKEDSFLSQVSSIIHKSFSDASKSLKNINPDNDWGTESWTSGISKGLGFNSNSPSHSSLPDTLSKFVNSIHEFKAPGSIPFFEPPPQWSQNLSGPNLPQHDWLNSVVNQSTSFFTSLSGVFAPEKQEPSTKDDKSIQAEIRRRVEKSLAERLTASPKTKPNSHEEAISAATIATQLAINASAKARSLSSSFASTPTKRPPSPQLRSQTYHSQHSEILSRANSVVGEQIKPSLTNSTSSNMTQSRSDLKRKRIEEVPPARTPCQPLKAKNYNNVAVFTAYSGSPASKHVANKQTATTIKSDDLSPRPQKKPRTM